MSKLIRRLLSIAIIFVGLCTVFLIIHVPVGSLLWWIWIVWNLFLALVPLVLSSLIVYFIGQKSPRKVLIVALSVLWLLFLPNAFYYLTDLMWITRIAETGMGFRPENIHGIEVWAVLMTVGIAEFVAVLAGIVSLRDVHRIIASKIDKWKTALIITTIIILNGFAIYMGRFLRLNSWDIIMPWRLISAIFNNIGAFSIEFTLLMSATIGIVYGIYLLITRGDT